MQVNSMGKYVSCSEPAQLTRWTGSSPRAANFGQKVRKHECTSLV